MDIEERRRALAQLEQMQSDFAHMNRVSTMGELAASLSHEITQPIASARNNARAAQNFLDVQPPDFGEVREALSCVVGDTDRAGNIIDRIRDHIKKAPPRKAQFDLNEAINEVIILARGAVIKKRVRHVVGLLAAAVAATTVSGIGGAVTYRLMRGPSASMLDSWQHWFASDFVGIIAVAPLVVGLAAVVRRPSPRSEVIEGTLGVLALALVTGLIISLPRVLWETVFPITWLFPVLVWLAARDRPAFSAAGAFLVSITIVLTTILGIGHFGDASHPINDRILGAQAGILVVTLSAYVLAAIYLPSGGRVRQTSLPQTRCWSASETISC